MSIKNKIGELIDRIILPDSDKLLKKLEKKKDKTDKMIISNLTSNRDDLKDVILETYEDMGSAYVHFNDYDNLINDLKEREYISPKYQEDVIRKDIMLSFYKIKDKKGQTWFLVIDITNSPNIGLRDYWKVTT